MVLEKIAKGFPDKYLDVVQHSEPSSLTKAPLLLRRPWELILRQLHKCNTTVAGDAMHPMTPDMGQGGCTALEDAVVLARNIAKEIYSDGTGSPNWGRAHEALSKYVSERRWRVAGMITGSYLSGWVQQGKPGWWARMLRNSIFYKLLFGKLMSAVDYDCGTLPAVKSSSNKLVE